MARKIFISMPTSFMSIYAKEEEEKNKKTEWPTFHRVLLNKKCEYLFSISLTYQMIVSSFSNARCFFIR